MHWVELGATLHMVLMFISCHWIILLSFYLFYYVECNCDSEIFCRGPILEKVQMSGIFADSKQFVDMPTSKSKAVVRKLLFFQSLIIFRCCETFLLYRLMQQMFN